MEILAEEKVDVNLEKKLAGEGSGRGASGGGERREGWCCGGSIGGGGGGA